MAVMVNISTKVTLNVAPVAMATPASKKRFLEELEYGMETYSAPPMVVL